MAILTAALGPVESSSPEDAPEKKSRNDELAYLGMRGVATRDNISRRSPYLLWLRNEGATALVNLQPWGGAMFCGDIVVSLNYVFKDNVLTTSSRGGGRKAMKEEKDEAMLRHAHKHTLLYKEMPR